jgi:sugar O-acyltransferase (sialic acid O-acetyltransferase NeuD family)
MQAKNEIAIYGAGGFAREVAWLLSSYQLSKKYNFIGYVEDNSKEKKIINRKSVYSLESLFALFPASLISVAVGDPLARRKLVTNSSNLGFDFATLVHESVDLSGNIKIERGAIICCGSILTVDIKIERHVQINLHCTIGHDVKINAFTTLSPGVHVSGNVHIGKNVFIGTGVSIINGTAESPLKIGDNCVIAAGACVTSHTEPNAMYAGVPANLKKYL